MRDLSTIESPPPFSLTEWLSRTLLLCPSFRDSVAFPGPLPPASSSGRAGTLPSSAHMDFFFFFPFTWQFSSLLGGSWGCARFFCSFQSATLLISCGWFFFSGAWSFYWSCNFVCFFSCLLSFLELCLGASLSPRVAPDFSCRSYWHVFPPQTASF